MCATGYRRHIDAEREVQNVFWNANLSLIAETVQYRHGTGSSAAKPNCLKIR